MAKLFSSAAVKHTAAPNSQVSLFDAGLPGTLPVLNRRCLVQGLKAAMALKCSVHRVSQFERKHYFYPDLPHGYQITQHQRPLATDGKVTLSDGSIVRVERLQVEQDSGKTLHDVFDGGSLLDLNRAGVCLLEVVSAPDMHSPSSASDFVRSVQELVVAAGVSDGVMADGSLRADVNVSMEPADGSAMGNRVEVKNLNSLRSVRRAVVAEMERQSELIRTGQPVLSETRRFDVTTGLTISSRSKEGGVDYRIHPDPDLPLCVVSEELLQEAASEMPELPPEQRTRLISQYGVSSYDAGVLVDTPGAVCYFENVAAETGAQPAASWVCNEMFAHTSERGFLECPVGAESLAALIRLVESGAISRRNARRFLMDAVDGGTQDWQTAASEQGVLRLVTKQSGDGAEAAQTSDEEDVAAICRRLVSENPAEAAKFRSGKSRLLGWFIKLALDEIPAAQPKEVSAIMKATLNALPES